VSCRSSRSPASTPERRYGLTFTRTGLLWPCTTGSGLVGNDGASKPVKVTVTRCHLPPIRHLPADSWTRLPFRLVNLGDRAAPKINISITPESGFRVKPESVAIGAIGPHSAAHSGFWIEPRRAGRFKVMLAAQSTANSPGVEVSLLAGGGDAGDDTLKDLAIVMAIVCAAGLLVLRRWPAPG
jgi:hypothetical protein